MIFTLYSGCMLKDSYAEVFAPSALESYLNTLPQTTINLDASYPTLYGRIQLDTAYMDSPFEYNYMRIEDTTNDLYYYCFITAIDFLADALVSVSYAVDVWNTYINKVSLRNSILGNTKYLNGNYGYLPIEYETVSPLTWDLLTLNDQYLNGQVNLLMEFQVYDLVSSEDQRTTNRETFVGFVTGSYDYTSAQVNYQVEEAEEMIQTLIRLAGPKPFLVGLPVIDDKGNTIYRNGVPQNALNQPRISRYYEITNIYMIPASWGNYIVNEYPMTLTFGAGITISPTTAGFEAYIWLPCREYTEDNKTKYSKPRPEWKNFLHKTISNNYKNVGLGPFSNPVFIKNNGEPSTLDLSVSMDAFNFNLLMNFQGQTYDITSFYTINMPFTSINGETSQLRKIADQEKRRNAEIKMAGSWVSEIGSTISRWTGTGAGTPSDTIASKIGSQIQSAGQFATTLGTNINAIKAATADKYQTSYGQSIDIVAAVNAYYGLVLFRKTSTYNDAEVSFAIENAGYETNIIVSDLRSPWNPLNLTNIDYNPTRYSYINLYGSAPQNIIKHLERILTSGTKIYYRWS